MRDRKTRLDKATTQGVQRKNLSQDHIYVALSQSSSKLSGTSFTYCLKNKLPHDTHGLTNYLSSPQEKSTDPTYDRNMEGGK